MDSADAGMGQRREAEMGWRGEAEMGWHGIAVVRDGWHKEVSRDAAMR
jgi:hypothetical protein